MAKGFAFFNITERYLPSNMKEKQILSNAKNSPSIDVFGCDNDFSFSVPVDIKEGSNVSPDLRPPPPTMDSQVNASA